MSALHTSADDVSPHGETRFAPSSPSTPPTASSPAPRRAPRRRQHTPWPSAQPQLDVPAPAAIEPAAPAPVAPAPAAAEPLMTAEPAVTELPPAAAPLPASPITVGAVSKPPPGFTMTGVVTAESPSLTAPPVQAAAPSPAAAQPAPPAPAPLAPPATPAQPVAYEQPVQPAQPTPYEQPVHPVQPTPYEQPVQPVQLAAYEQPIDPVQPAAYEQPVQPVQPAPYEQPIHPVQPAAYEQPIHPVQPAPYEQPVQPVAYEQPVQSVAYEHLVEPAPYEHPVQPVQPAAYEHPVQPAQPIAYEQPVAYEQPNQPVAHEAVAYEQPVAPAEPTPYEQPLVPAEPAPHEQPVAPIAYEQPVAPAEPAPYEQPLAYEQPLQPDPQLDWQQPLVYDAVAAHPELYGEDATLLVDEDDEDAPVDDRELVAGSALLTAALTWIPRPADLQRFGRERWATARVAGAALVAIALAFVLVPVLIGALSGLPLVGPAAEQLESISLFPKVYGATYWIGALALVSVTGIVVAQMEHTAQKQGLRWDQERRLSISLAGLLAMVLVSGAFTAFGNVGWAAAVASTGFFISLCLLVPLWNLPGARVMATQSERSWLLLLGLGIASLVVTPTFPGLLIVLLAFTRIRTHWAQVRDGQEEDEIDGPLDRGSRRATIALLSAALVAASLGAMAMTESVSSLNTPEGISPNAFPGAEEGPTIPAPKG